MNKNIPNQNVLNAFSVSGKPIQLTGGGGVCFRVDDIVLKPTKNSTEASWIAEIYNNLESEKFRIPKPIQTKDKSWVYSDYTANKYLEGEIKKDNYIEAIKVGNEFHKSLSNIPKPDWFDKKTDIFALADRMAWGEIPIHNYKIANETLEEAFNLLKENRLPNQLIHGDWGPEQILFHDNLLPAVLDMTPYFRPAEYPIADMLISAVINDGTDTSIINLGKDIKDFDQLLLRAFIFRTCTYIGLQVHPGNNFDWNNEIIKYLNFFEDLTKIIKLI